jgi:hypothetical protein
LKRIRSPGSRDIPKPLQLKRPSSAASGASRAVVWAIDVAFMAAEIIACTGAVGGRDGGGRAADREFRLARRQDRVLEFLKLRLEAN